MAGVVLQNVSKTFPTGVRAVNGLSLDVADGEFLTLVGPSASGKTTTLRLIAGLEELTTGSIQIGGRSIDRLPPGGRDVALVFQRHNLYPHLTVRKNLTFGLRLKHSLGRRLVNVLRGVFSSGNSSAGGLSSREIRRRVTETARVLDLEAELDRKPDELSGGQQQRAALGRALVRRPGVLLLDEPLSHLDPALRGEMRRQLHLLHRQFPATIIYVTHDQVEAMSLGRRVAVLAQGVLQQVDAPEILYRRPRNRFVAGFIGWPPMSFFEGQLVGPELVGEGWRLALPAETLAGWQVDGRAELSVGVRPEDVRINAKTDGGSGLRMEVTLVEPLGAERLVTLQRGEAQLTSRIGDGHDVVPVEGQVVDVVIDMTKIYGFDRASGLALAGPAG